MLALSVYSVEELRPQSRMRPGVEPSPEEGGPAPNENPPPPVDGASADARRCTVIREQRALIFTLRLIFVLRIPGI